MLKKIKGQLLLATALSWTLINFVSFEILTNNQTVEINLDSQAYARSSGGRTRGGSFKKRRSNSPSNSSRQKKSRPSTPSSSFNRKKRISPPSPSPSFNQRKSTSSPSPLPSFNQRKSTSSPNLSPNLSPRNNPNPPSPSPSPSTNLNNTNSPTYPSNSSNNRNRNITPNSRSYNRNYRSNSGGSIFPMFLLVGFLGVLALIIVASMLNSKKSGAVAGAGANRERDNDIVTVSKLQVALFAHTQGIQSELSQLSLTIDTNTEEGLLELLQESALILLRNSENWSHVLASSESIHIDKAEQAFNKLSLEERSKFNAETLTNVNGSVKQREAVIPDNEIADYIVVTLLAGTADDKPLFGKINSTEELTEALQKLASLRSDYLMTFELLWSPQSEDDSLTYDELLTEYTNMVQVA